MTPEIELPLWGAMTWPEAEAFAARDPVAVLPLAATEQHGPHLPLSTDHHIGMGLLREAFRRLPDNVPARVLPVQEVGASLEHLRFPGTLSLPAPDLSETVYEIGGAVARAGVRRLLLANSHGGNRGVMEAAGLRLREEWDLLVVKATYTRFPPPPPEALPRPRFPEPEWTHGLHGGAVETSMMLHLRPELVGEMEEPGESLGEELEEEMERLGPEGEASFSWLAGDLHAAGVVGSPGLASAEAGRILVEHYGRILAQVIRDTLAFPLHRLEGPPRSGSD